MCLDLSFFLFMDNIFFKISHQHNSLSVIVFTVNVINIPRLNQQKPMTRLCQEKQELFSNLSKFCDTLKSQML